MIKVISFDIGGTLLKSSDNDSKKYDLRSLASLLNLPYDNVRDAYKSVYQKSNGTFDELLNRFCDKLNIVPSDDLITFFKNKFIVSDSKISNENKELIKKLKSLGYKVILFSNSCSLLNNEIDNDLVNILDGIFYSFEIGYTKNESESYKYVESKLNNKPEEFLHIGDTLSSDYQIPLRNGWNALYYGNIDDTSVKSIDDLEKIFEYL